MIFSNPDIFATLCRRPVIFRVESTNNTNQLDTFSILEILMSCHYATI